jgi:hypothetical protein
MIGGMLGTNRCVNKAMAAPIEVSAIEGYVATEGHSANATNVYARKIISFEGTGAVPSDTVVNELGKFSCILKVDDIVVKGYKLQGSFRGDEHYKQSSSNIVSYGTRIHDTELALRIYPLKLNLPYTQPKAEQKITLKPGEYFRIAGLLLDSSLNIPIPSMRIYIEKEFGQNIFDITKGDGTYKSEGIKSSKSSEITLLIRDQISNADYDLGKSLRPIPLSFVQSQENKSIYLTCIQIISCI